MRAALVVVASLALGACAGTPRRGALPERSKAPPPPASLDAIPDAVPRIEPRSEHGNPVSYEVFGKRYTLLPTAEGYKERGVASWYGPDFHAHATASGEPYDMYAMTAAHKTLPIPAYARVTNLANGRSVVVRINDRGPFVDNRLIDLSYTAAYKLDMTRTGTAFVEVEVITPGAPQEIARAVTPPAPPSLAPPRLFLQAGAFSVADNAGQMLSRLRAAGIADAAIVAPAPGERLYRVRVGPVADVDAYDALADQLTKLGIATLLVTE
ncbi:MAG TPA: septal ring lytic transglycosylase RlpA family protein [Steroidobacteraceae bacterium]|nr:septal ring lytic transglycosylase RlpA family protein [Steroidobacteraceae bacterium]